MISASINRKVKKNPVSKDDFIVKWITTTDNYTIILPLPNEGVYNFDIDWGDGITEHYNDFNASHTYAKAGTYYTRMKGVFHGFYLYDSASVGAKTYIYDGSTKDMIDSIVQWGTNKFYSIRFPGSSLAEIPSSGAAPDFSGVTNMFGLFALCQLRTNPHKHLYKNCQNVTDFHAPYSRCNITEIPRGLLDNLSSVYDIGSVYAHNLLTYIPDNHFIGCGSAVITTNMFRNNNITVIPDGLVDPLVNSEQMAFAFGENPWTVIPNGFFINNPLVFYWEDCFANSGIQVIPENMFGTNLTNMNLKTMFLNADVQYIPALLLANCPNVVDFTSAFANNPVLGSIPDWWNQYPTAIGTDCFAGSTGFVNNAEDVPLEWK